MGLLLDALKMQNSPIPISAETGKAGKKLFSANTTASNRRFKLGMALIAIIIFTAGAGYVIYFEKDSPAPNKIKSTSPPPPPSHPASLATPHPVIASKPAPSVKPSPRVPQSRKAAATSRLARPSHTVKDRQVVAIQHQPDSIDLLLKRAYQSYQKGDYASAWQLYKSALSQEANNRDALLGLAVIAQLQEKNALALNYYRQVLRLDPRDPVANAGLSRFISGAPSSKESHLKQLIEQQPDSAVLYFALGHQYAEQSRWSDAQRSYFNALTMAPGNAIFTFNLAISLDHMGQHKVAAKYYQQTLQLSTAANSNLYRAKAQQRLNELSSLGE